VYIDSYYIILVIPALLLGVWAQYRVNSTFQKYSQVSGSRGCTGAMAAEMILRNNGITDVQVEHISGNLTDHYDPAAGVIRLSDSVYNSRSIAAVGVAAHEAGHAVQYSVGYAPIKIRNLFVPVANIGSKISIPLIFLGLLLSFQKLISFGILLFAAVALFQLITLPVEFNASNRALAVIQEQGLLADDEVSGARKVLSAAAMTYVAALISTVAQLLRLIGLYGDRGRRRD
jgi:hypothetical protein